MSEKLNVYLFGPLGDGRVNEPTLKVIQRGIESNDGKVLTPHVANWEEAVRLRQDKGWQWLWEDFDKGQMRKADCGMGEVSYPSIGVGREIERLSTYRIPVVAFRSIESTYQTACLDGDSNPGLFLTIYDGLDKLSLLVANYMLGIKEALDTHPLLHTPLTPFQLSKIRENING